MGVRDLKEAIEKKLAKSPQPKLSPDQPHVAPRKPVVTPKPQQLLVRAQSGDSKTEAVKEWVGGLKDQAGSGSDVPELLGELLEDPKCAEVLVPHLHKLCSGSEPLKLKAGPSATGAEYNFVKPCITVSKTKMVGGSMEAIPKYHQLWAFLFETCNAVHGSEFQKIKKAECAWTPRALREYGEKMSDVEADTCEDSSNLAEKLWARLKDKKGATLDANTDKQLERHRNLHAKPGGNWKAELKDNPHKPGEVNTLPSSMCSPDFYAYEKLYLAQATQAEKLIQNVFQNKGIQLSTGEIHQVVNQNGTISSSNAPEKFRALSQIIRTLDPKRKVSLGDLVHDPSPGPYCFRAFMENNKKKYEG